ncbi:MAG: HalD/BesD family halogenase [Micromonosporaceae bacterium]
MIDEVVDIARYPLTTPTSTAWQDLISRVRDDLRAYGCSVLPDFVRPELRDLLREQGGEIAPRAHYDVETVNAYNIAVDTPLPDGHPARVTMRRGNAFVARDQIPESHLIHRLYTDESFKRFVAHCFALSEIHELADPLSGLCLNVVSPGMSHPWHFDTNEFTVSMLTQEPESGGVFEYCPHIRSAADEHFDHVREVLTGTREHGNRQLTLRPGDLQLFQGRYALHRVTTVTGEIPRHSAIFAYSERPGVIGSVARTRQLFGRTLPVHAAAESRVRGDQLLD